MNDGFVYCVPQKILVCKSSYFGQIRRRGRCVSRKGISRSRRNLGYVP